MLSPTIWIYFYRIVPSVRRKNTTGSISEKKSKKCQKHTSIPERSSKHDRIASSVTQPFSIASSFFDPNVTIPRLANRYHSSYTDCELDSDEDILSNTMLSKSYQEVFQPIEEPQERVIMYDEQSDESGN